MEHKKILLGITTTRRSNWRKKIEDIRRYEIEEVALFPTYLNAHERKELYERLSDSSVKRIPHVHLRTDMTMEEIAYLITRFDVQRFNIHPSGSKYHFLSDYAKHADRIYVENSGSVPSAEDLKKYAGLCIDFAHWQAGHHHAYDGLGVLAESYPIGCCHISAARYVWWRLRYEDDHMFRALSDFDYIKKYKKYIPDIVSLELENELKDQLMAKAYIQKIIA